MYLVHLMHVNLNQKTHQESTCLHAALSLEILIHYRGDNIFGG